MPLKFFPILLVTGPRQSGKTYLCKQLFPDYESIRNIFHEITKIIKH